MRGTVNGRREQHRPDRVNSDGRFANQCELAVFICPEGNRMSDNAVLATTEGQLLSADSTTDNSYMPCIELRRFVQTLLSEKVCGNRLEAERVSGVNRGRFYKAMYYEPRFRAWFSEQCDLFLA